MPIVRRKFVNESQTKNAKRWTDHAWWVGIPLGQERKKQHHPGGKLFRQVQSEDDGDNVEEVLITAPTTDGKVSFFRVKNGDHHNKYLTEKKLLLPQTPVHCQSIYFMLFSFFRFVCHLVLPSYGTRNRELLSPSLVWLSNSFDSARADVLWLQYFIDSIPSDFE